MDFLFLALVWNWHQGLKESATTLQSGSFGTDQLFSFAIGQLLPYSRWTAVQLLPIDGRFNSYQGAKVAEGHPVNFSRVAAFELLVGPSCSYFGAHQSFIYGRHTAMLLTSYSSRSRELIQILLSCTWVPKNNRHVSCKVYCALQAFVPFKTTLFTLFRDK